MLIHLRRCVQEKDDAKVGLVALKGKMKAVKDALKFKRHNKPVFLTTAAGEPIPHRSPKVRSLRSALLTSGHFQQQHNG